MPITQGGCSEGEGDAAVLGELCGQWDRSGSAAQRERVGPRAPGEPNSKAMGGVGGRGGCEGGGCEGGRDGALAGGGIFPSEGREVGGVNCAPLRCCSSGCVVDVVVGAV